MSVREQNDETEVFRACWVKCSQIEEYMTTDVMYIYSCLLGHTPSDLAFGGAGLDNRSAPKHQLQQHMPCFPL